jgi:hypothetical protein
LKINGDIRVCTFVDSSGGNDEQSKARAGYVTSIGSEGYGGPIEASAFRSKTNGRSMVEYELFAFHEMLPSPLFVVELLEEIGYPQQPILIFEDNKALIDLIRRGKISTGVTRHIHAKYYYGKDLLLRKIIEFRHCPTLLMIADIFTKDIDGPRFLKLCRRLRNEIEQDPSMNDEVFARLYANSNTDVYMDTEEIAAIEITSAIIEQLIQS